MYCMKCGTQLPDEAIFCYSCGSKIGIPSDGIENKKSSSLQETSAEKRPAYETSTIAESKSISEPLPQKKLEDEEEEYYEEDEEAEVEEEDNEDEGEEFYYEEDEETEEEISYAASLKDPKTDPYWDDIIPDMEDELNRLPKDIIAKGIGIIVGLFLLIAYLVYTLS